VRLISLGLRYDDNPTIRKDIAMDALIPQKSPYATPVEASKSYYWCSCGQSKAQPFCDGSHKGSGFTPVKFDATESKTVYFCGCKQSANKPLCDGAHKAIA
jgi:CDGSH-type Zn-finger protein